MARKKSNVPPAVRLRDNQRRSRARQKEYVEDIKKKLLDLEERGVHATVEVQQAARKVAKENRLLRELLARKGVSQQEVNDFLRIFGESSINEIPCISKCQVPAQFVGATAAAQPCSRTADTSPTSSETPERFPSTYNDQHELLIRSTMGSRMDCLTPSSAPENTGLDTSCEEAAAIIATLRGHGDQERVRSELGCEALTSCRIENTSLLDIMDA